MQNHPSSQHKKFAQLLRQNNAVRFGNFTTKSGRPSRYFLNLGSLFSSDSLYQLSYLYAEKINETWGAHSGITNIFGPSYKGIPLAVMVSHILSNEFGFQDMSFSFNRKEKKDHGEQGLIVGNQYQQKQQVIIVEDVLTAGTSLKESLSLLQTKNIKPKGVVVGIDRQEKGTKDLLAKKEIEEDYKLKIISLLDVSTLFKII